MKVGIALAMGMADDIDRDAIDKYGEVRAMVGVKATEENLIALAAAVMLADDQPRRQPKHVAWSVGRAKFQIFCPARLFRSCRRRLLAPNILFNGFSAINRFAD